MATSRILPLAFGCVVVGLGATASVRAQQYSLTNLGTLGGNEAAAYGINASSQVVGGSQTIPNDHVDGHAFLYSDGGPMTDLGSIGGGNWSVANAINASGAITGAAGIAGAAHQAVIFDNGHIIGLGTLGGTSSVGSSINSRGQAAGASFISGGTGTTSHAFLYTPGHGMMDIGTLPGGTTSIAEGINNRGNVVGYGDVDHGATTHAFLYDNGKMSDLGTLPTSGNVIPRSAANAINAAGVVVGFSSVGGQGFEHAFSYSPGLGMSDLGTLGGDSIAWGISNNGEIVGGSYLANGSEHAFLFTDGKMIDLNTLLSPSVASLYTVVVADGINNHGQIAASGYLDSNPSYSQAFLLTPAPSVPTPASIWLLLGGIGALAWKCLCQISRPV
jgi:probable HAF family extracellular repeat protein